MADDTFITVSWYIDPDASKVYYSINNAEPVGVTNANLPDDEELTVYHNGTVRLDAYDISFLTFPVFIAATLYDYDDLRLFLGMIGEQYDNIRNYIDNYSSFYNKRIRTRIWPTIFRK